MSHTMPPLGPSSEPTEGVTLWTGGVRLSSLTWLLAAAGTALGAVLISWIAVGVLVSAGWLAAGSMGFPAVADTIGQGWLLTLGARVTLGGMTLTIPPLGISMLAWLVLLLGTSYSARWLSPEARTLRRSPWQLAAAVTLIYAVIVLIVASLVGTPAQATQAVGAAAVGAAVAASLGALHGCRPAFLDQTPTWLRDLLRAGAVGLGVLGVGSLAAFVVGLVLRWDRVMALHAALGPDTAGSVLLVFVYLAFGPNIVLWAGSYVLGAGFSVGAGTLVAPGSSRLGLLPTFPVLGAVPAQGAPLDWGWLSVGVLAAVSTGVAFVRWLRRRGELPTPLTAAWQSVLGGVTVALVWSGFAALSRGDVGVRRLVGLGPLLPETLLFSLAAFVVFTPIAGAALAWWWGRQDAAASDPEQPD